MPVGRRNNRFAGPKSIGQGSRGYLRFIQIGCDVKVRGSDELLQILEFHEAVVEDDVLFDLVLLGKKFQTHPVGFAVLAQFVRMRGAQDNINNLWKFLQNIRQRIEHAFDALVRRKQAEGEQHHLSFYAELILEVGRVDEPDVGDAVRDQVDLGCRGVVNILQHSSSALNHDNQPRGERKQLLHHAPLVGPGIAQKGMQRRNNRHSKFAEKRKDVTAGGPAVNAEFVLQTDHVYVADVEEVSGAQVGRQVLLLNFEANHFRILVAARDVVDRHCQALALGMRACYGGKQIGREGSNSTLARQVVPDKSDLANFRIFFNHDFHLSLHPFSPNDEPIGSRTHEVKRMTSDESQDLIPAGIQYR